MKICGIYKITSPNKKVYIGQSINIIARWNRYKRLYCEKQSSLYNSFKKYGIDKHNFEIICQCNRSELNNLEVYYIELYQSLNSKKGLNLRTGGDIYTMTDEAKRNMSIAHKGKPLSEKHKKSLQGRKFSEKGKSKMGSAWRGKKMPREIVEKMRNTRIKNNSYKHSEETKEKMSKSHKGLVMKSRGKKLTQEQKDKLRDANIGKIPWNKGKKLSEEHVRNLSKSHIGQHAWNKGKSLSESHRQALSLAKKKKILNT